MARLTDVQLGAVRRQLEHVLTLVPGPAPAGSSDARRRWCRERWGVESLDEVGKCWAAAVNALGTTLNTVGLADGMRRDRPATPRNLVLQDLDRTAEYAHTILCLAVDAAEGRAVMQRKRSGLSVPEAEAERAAELGVDGWQVAEVLTTLLHVDEATFRRFLDDLRCRVETVLADAGSDGDGPSPAASSPPTSTFHLRSALAELRQLHDDLVRRGRPGAPPLPDADLTRLWALDSQVESLATRYGIARPDAGRPSANWQERGWTRICYHHSNKGVRVVGGTNWDAGMDRLEALAALVDDDSPTPPAAVGSDQAPPGKALGRRLPAAQRRLKEPSKDAFAVYRYWFASNCVLSSRKTQQELACDPQLMALLGRKVDQGTISRWLKQVREWIEAGNVLPDLPEPLGSEPVPMDPDWIELGERQDGLAKRQRGRCNSDHDD